MAIRPGDLKLYGSKVMSENDTTEEIGGAIDYTRMVSFSDLTGLCQAISSHASDTTQTVTITYRDTTGSVLTATITLNGTAAVTHAALPRSVLKALKSATCLGDVAIERQTATRTGTAQSGSGITDEITLDASASASASAYAWMVIRLTGGTGAGQIRYIVSYDGITKIAIVNRVWTTPPDNTTTFRISKGIVFEKTPHEVLEVRRIFYGGAPEPLGDLVTKTLHEKVFWVNTHATLSLTNATIEEVTDVYDLFEFAVAPTKGDTDTNGAGNNRTVAPTTGLSFSSDSDGVPGDVLNAGESIGVWLALTLVPGEIAIHDPYIPRLIGQTI
jgi:hypothetical protein